MTITIDSTTLCSGSSRSTDGSATGPDNLQGGITGGVIDREYIGADGIEPENIGLARTACSFGVTRIFDSADLAHAWVADNLKTHGALTGALKFGDKTHMDKAAVTNIGYAVVGSTLALRYTIAGY